jgi:hypothetical protein
MLCITTATRCSRTGKLPLYDELRIMNRED